MLAGARPIFVDVKRETLCLDVDDLKKKINRKSSLILPVHFGGLPCDLSEITKISEKNHIPIVEDAAHATGAKFGNKKIGTHSEIICFSFHPVKNLSMPTGGAITLNKKFSKKLQELECHHIIPKEIEGPESPYNYAYLCVECHKKITFAIRNDAGLYVDAEINDLVVFADGPNVVSDSGKVVVS